MAIKTFTAGSVLTASDTNTFLANAGLVYIKEVALSTGSTRDITSCFSSTYDAYRLIIVNLLTNGTDPIALQLLSSSTPAATGYDRQRFYAQGTTLGGSRTTNQASLLIGYTATSPRQNYQYDIFAPNLATATAFIGSQAYDDNPNINIDMTTGKHTTASAYDGLRLLCGANTFTGGKAIIYGYRQS